jgi:hypothetical protein
MGAPILRRDGIRWADHLRDERQRDAVKPDAVKPDAVKRDEAKREGPAAWRAPLERAVRWMAVAQQCAPHWLTVSGTHLVAVLAATTEVRLEAPTRRLRRD